ncbi:unnamed protein product [Agarophyton chilense]
MNHYQSSLTVIMTISRLCGYFAVDLRVIEEIEFCAIIPSSPTVERETVAIGIVTIRFHPICVQCKCGLPSERGQQAHLRAKHSVSDADSGNAAQKVWEKRMEMVSKLPFLPLLDAYFGTPYNCKQQLPTVLDPILGLEVYDGYQCLVCSSCCTEKKTWKMHLGKAHSLDEAPKRQVKAEHRCKIKLHPLLPSKRFRKYFPLSLKKPVREFILVLIFDAKPQSIRTHPCFPNASDADRTSSANTRKITTAARDISNMLTNLNRDADNHVVKDELKSTFVSLSGVDEILKDRKLELAETYMLGSSDTSNINYIPFLLEVFISYLTKIPDISLEISPSVFTWCKVRSRGERQQPFRTVSAKAYEQYSSEIVRLVKFFYRSTQLRPDLVDKRKQRSSS